MRLRGVPAQFGWQCGGYFKSVCVCVCVQVVLYVLLVADVLCGHMFVFLFVGLCANAHSSLSRFVSASL